MRGSVQCTLCLVMNDQKVGWLRLFYILIQKSYLIFFKDENNIYGDNETKAGNKSPEINLINKIKINKNHRIMHRFFTIKCYYCVPTFKPVYIVGINEWNSKRKCAQRKQVRAHVITLSAKVYYSFYGFCRPDARDQSWILHFMYLLYFYFHFCLCAK